MSFPTIVLRVLAVAAAFCLSIPAYRMNLFIMSYYRFLTTGNSENAYP
jgi:hypothetical protein